jgi:PhnB protein
MIIPMLSVKDIAQSISFYEKLGFQKQMAMPGPDGVLAFAFVQLGSDSIGLNRMSDVPETPYIEFMISVPEGTQIDGYYQQVKAQGIAIAEEIKNQYWGDRSFTVVDPDGYKIALFQTIEQINMDKVAAVMRGDAKPE